MIRVEFSSSASKFLKKTEKIIALRIIERIKELRNNPFPPDAKRVVGHKDKIFRIRVGSYRIQYTLFYERKLLFISAIGKRDKAYD